MIIEVFILIILIFMNGLFSSSEIAFLSINKNKLESLVQKKNKKAIKIQKLLEDTSGFLATIQIGITFAGFLASAFASETFADYILQYITIDGISTTLLKSIIVIIITLVLSYFTLVFGELVPKKLGLYDPERIAFLMVNPIYVLMKITYPFVAFLKASTNLVCKILKINDKQDEVITEEEIKVIISESLEDGEIEKEEKELIFNVFEFNDTEVKEIMTKSEEVAIIHENADIKDVLEYVKRYKFTRFPVCSKDNYNEIIGILNIKDIVLKYNSKDRREFKILDYMREATYIYENEKVDDLFRLMQTNKLAMVIVCNEDKNFVGVATLEDALEEIVGNISDEFV